TMTSLLPQHPSNYPLNSPGHSPSLSSDAQLLSQFGFIPGVRDLLILRQVHALEHATIWILSGARPPLTLTATAYRGYSLTRSDDGRFGGLSTPQGFYLTGDITLQALRRASMLALKRLNAGEWDLAIHPRCGTNASVTMALVTGLSLAAHALIPRRPLEQMLGLGAAAAAATALTPTAGAIAQRYVTTAIPSNLVIDTIYPIHHDDPENQPRQHFVKTKWVDI
ncbi:MAG: DUF6391 domain-containing protein, partial [Elainellaceae cyanobacterium]